MSNSYKIDSFIIEEKKGFHFPTILFRTKSKVSKNYFTYSVTKNQLRIKSFNKIQLSNNEQTFKVKNKKIFKTGDEPVFCFFQSKDDWLIGRKHEILVRYNYLLHEEKSFSLLKIANFFNTLVYKKIAVNQIRQNFPKISITNTIHKNATNKSYLEILEYYIASMNTGKVNIQDIVCLSKQNNFIIFNNFYISFEKFLELKPKLLKKKTKKQKKIIELLVKVYEKSSLFPEDEKDLENIVSIIENKNINNLYSPFPTNLENVEVGELSLPEYAKKIEIRLWEKSQEILATKITIKRDEIEQDELIQKAIKIIKRK